MKRIDRYCKGKIIMFFFALTVLIYAYMFFVSMPAIEVFSSGELIFDLKTGGYDYEYAIRLLDTLGEKGRAAYLFPQLILDMFFPLAYVPFLVLLSGLLLHKSKLTGTVLDYTLLIPIIPGLADYGENISSIILINSFPDISPSLVEFASLCTVLKSTGLVLSILLLIVFLAATYIRRSNYS